MNIKRKIINLLKKLGLSEKEAEFLFLVQNYAKGLTMSEIRKKLKVSTATTYRAFEKLHGLGFVTSSANNWKKNVQAVSFATIADKIAKKKKNLARVEYEMRNLDSLLNLNPQACIGEGVEVLTEENQLIDKYFRIMSQEWDQLLGYGSVNTILSIFGEKLEMDFIKNRVRKGRSAFACFNKGSFAETLHEEDEKHLRNSKLIDDPSYENDIFYVYGDEVTVWSNSEQAGKRAVVITDPLLVKPFKRTFDYMWKNACFSN